MNPNRGARAIRSSCPVILRLEVCSTILEFEDSSSSIVLRAMEQGESSVTSSVSEGADTCCWWKIEQNEDRKLGKQNEKSRVDSDDRDLLEESTSDFRSTHKRVTSHTHSSDERKSSDKALRIDLDESGPNEDERERLVDLRIFCSRSRLLQECTSVYRSDLRRL
jgi:hypothetical protein